MSLSVLRGLISGTREPIRRIRFRFKIDSFVSFHPTEYNDRIHDRDLKTRSLSRLRSSQTTHDDNGDVCQDMFVSTRSSQLRVLTSHLTRVTTRLREAEAPAGHRGRAVCSRATVARLSNLVEEDPPGCACANPPRERGRKEVDLVVTEYVPSRNPRRRVRRLLDDELLFRTPA